MTRRFTARTAGIEVPDIGEIPPYWIRVVVHDADHQMRRAYAKHSGGSIRNVADVGGGFTHAVKAGHNGYLGILRFSAESLPIEFIVHESIHVAVFLAQTYFGSNPLRLPTGGKGTREEVIAYVGGSLAEALIEKLIPGVPTRETLWPQEA